MTEETNQPAEEQTTEVSQDVSESTQQSTEQPTEQATEQNYDYVPKKFLVDGKPDFENLSKSYQALEKKLGAKGSFAPETVDEYAYTPSNIEIDPEKSTAFKTAALEAGLSAKQYEFVMSQYEQEINAIMGSPEASEATLKADWGNQYQGNLSAARKAFDVYAPSDVSIEDPIFSHPAVLKVLARMGADLSEDNTPPKGGGSTSTMSQEKVDALMASPDYYDNLDKQAQVSAWFAKKYK